MMSEAVPPLLDPDTAALLCSIERGLAQAARGEGLVHTPTEIATRRGRPAQATHKQAVTLRLDPDALAAWRATGKGWQTRAAQVLTDWMKTNTHIT